MKKKTVEIRLREFEEKDIVLKTKWSNDPLINEFIEMKLPISILDTKNWFDKNSNNPNVNLFIIEDKENFESVGYMKMNIFPEEKTAELHLLIGEKKYWGKGIGTKATKEFLRIAFKELHFDSVFLTVKRNNFGAIKLYKKCGFQVVEEKSNSKSLFMIAKNVSYFEIGYRKVGENYPVFIIAEVGVNHNGDVKTAKKLIDIAKKAGVDAVKFQIWDTNKLILRNTKKVEYQNEMDNSENQYDMIKKLELTKEEHLELMDYCQKKEIIYLCTPTDETLVDFLVQNKVPALKVGSGELTNHEFLKYVAQKDVPLIFSTGLADISEIVSAINVVKSVKVNNNFVVMHCVSSYPAPLNSINLNVIDEIKKSHKLVGFSDHTIGALASSLAVAKGVKVIEKHFTLSKNLPGPDHKASLEPKELFYFVKQIRLSEQILGTGNKFISQTIQKTKKLIERSAVAAKNLKKGAILKKDDIVFKRPGYGILSKDIKTIIGRKLRYDISKDSMINYIDLE